MRAVRLLRQRVPGVLHQGGVRVKRILGLDVGEKRIGAAVSDPLGITAQGLDTIQAVGWGPDKARVRELLERYDTDRIVMGLPLTLSGEIGPQARKVMKFADVLRAEGWQVRFFDERLTTCAADRALREGNVKGDKRKQVVDRLAAQGILQGFLDAGGWTEPAIYRPKGARVMDNQNMEQDNIVELIDEDGKEVRFEHVMTVEYEGDAYILLSPAEPMEDLADDEVMILRIETDDEGNEVYETVEDEALLEAVFEEYLKIVEADEEE